MVDTNCQISKKGRFWQVHIVAWDKSGLSQNDYCRKNQLSSGQMGYWEKKLGWRPAPSLSFVPVPLDPPKLCASPNRDDSGLTIILGNSMYIRLENDFSPSALTKVLAVLGGQS